MTNAYGDYGYGTGIAYGTSGLVPNCHTGPLDVMEIGGSVIWASKWDDMNDDLTWDLRIRLNDRFAFLDGSPLINADEKAQKLFAATPELLAVQYPPTISINWPDYGTPPLDKAWWKGMVTALSNMPAGSNVAIYCQGGHGRTGTALSILAALSGNVPANTDPVYWVRKNYCEEAVESWSQIDYIGQMTGEEITSLPTSQLKANADKASGKNDLWQGFEKGPDGVWRKKEASVTPITKANSLFKTGKDQVKKLLKSGKKHQMVSV